jgi:hypothetical protein
LRQTAAATATGWNFPTSESGYQVARPDGAGGAQDEPEDAADTIPSPFIGVFLVKRAEEHAQRGQQQDEQAKDGKEGNTNPSILLRTGKITNNEAKTRLQQIRSGKLFFPVFGDPVSRQFGVQNRCDDLSQHPFDAFSGAALYSLHDLSDQGCLSRPPADGKNSPLTSRSLPAALMDRISPYPYALPASRVFPCRRASGTRTRRSLSRTGKPAAGW